MKLNKGEKRALKFMLQKETGQSVNVDAFLKTQDIMELKAMLAKDAKNAAGKHIKE